MDHLSEHFDRVAARLEEVRPHLNQLDTLNGNHGDHMVSIFALASQAAQKFANDDLADGMESASLLLLLQEDNASAQLYASGLKQFALQFRRHEIRLDDLERYIRAVLSDEKNPAVDASKSNEVLKALVTGLAGWQNAGKGENELQKGLDMGYLFDLGVAYIQAKQRASSKIEALAETAITVSPLGDTPYRARSGKLVIVSLLESLQQV